MFLMLLLLPIIRFDFYYINGTYIRISLTKVYYILFEIEAW